MFRVTFTKSATGETVSHVVPQNKLQAVLSRLIAQYAQEPGGFGLTVVPAGTLLEA